MHVRRFRQESFLNFVDIDKSKAHLLERAIINLFQRFYFRRSNVRKTPLGAVIYKFTVPIRARIDAILIMTGKNGTTCIPNLYSCPYMTYLPYSCVLTTER